MITLLIHVCITLADFGCTFIYIVDAIDDLKDPENKEKIGYEEKKTVFMMLQWLTAINCLTVLSGFVRIYYGCKMYQFCKSGGVVVHDSESMRRGDTSTLDGGIPYREMTESRNRYYYLLWTAYGEIFAEIAMLVIQIRINKMVYVDMLE